jgi:signal recognition particle receptor subunit beta
LHPSCSPSLSAINAIQIENERQFDLLPPLATCIAKIWSDPAIQKTYQRRSQFQLPDSARLFLDQVEELAKPSFIPDENHILSVRVRTTGIVQTEFVINNSDFHMYDVGGQRNERKKWIHCFENVTAVIFVAALSEYDQVLWEDESIGRLQEALNLFDEVCNSRWFVKTSMLLFLNKSDIFREKIANKPISQCLPEYTGPNTFEDQANYIKSLFEARKTQSRQDVYTHITCAMDSSQMKFVFNAVADSVLKENLRFSGLLVG